MYEAANMIFMAAGILFQGYCLQYFYGSFLKSRMRSQGQAGFCTWVLYNVPVGAFLERIFRPLGLQSRSGETGLVSVFSFCHCPLFL